MCEAVTDFSESAELSDWSRARIGSPFTRADSLRGRQIAACKLALLMIDSSKKKLNRTLGFEAQSSHFVKSAITLKTFT